MIGYETVKNGARSYIENSYFRNHKNLMTMMYSRLKLIFSRCYDTYFDLYGVKSSYYNDANEYELNDIFNTIVRVQTKIALDIVEETDLNRLGFLYSKFMYCLGFDPINTRYEVVPENEEE